MISDTDVKTAIHGLFESDESSEFKTIGLVNALFDEEDVLEKEEFVIRMLNPNCSWIFKEDSISVPK